MRAEKTNGAKIAPFYNAQADYARELEKERYTLTRDGLALANECYIIALGNRSPQVGASVDFADNVEMMTYAGESGGTTANPYDAKQFDTWADAMRYALDTYDFPALDFPAPRGFERPKYPRVCHARIWAELTEC